MQAATRESTRLRIAAIGLVSVSLFVGLFARLWFLEVIKQGSYDRVADGQAFRTIEVPAPRGRILDRHGKVLVGNEAQLVVTVDRQALAKVQDRNAVLSRLADLLNRYASPHQRYTIANLNEQLRSKLVSPYQPVPVAANVPQTVEIDLIEHPALFPAVTVSRVALRTYPYGTLAAHVLGYVGPISAAMWKAHQHDAVPYQKNDDVGRAGVEASFENYLRGRPGKRVVEVDPTGAIIRTVSETPPVPGHDVYLTIDANAQADAENSLAQGLQKARSSGNCNSHGCPPAPAGAMVVIDPMNGQVTALASNPTYDPSWFVPSITTARYAQLTSNGTHDPFTDRAVAGEYPPGSTFKLPSSLAGLRAGAITPQFTYDDTGYYRINGCSSNDPASTCVKQGDQAAAHGSVDLSSALTVSSDTYFYRVGDLLWNSSGRKREMIQDVARELGFGSRTGIELPDEQAGFVGTRELLKKLHDQYPKAYPYGDQWYSGNNANLAIGQDVVSATPIQLANAYATFGNGGTRYRPTLLLKVTKFHSNHVLLAPKPDVVGHVNIPPDWRQAMLTGFEGVTADSDGTAEGAFSAAGYPTSSLPVAGKTGTSQVNLDPQSRQALQDDSLFVGFAPANAPRYASAAVFEQSGYGAAVAAPAVVNFFLPLGQYARFPQVQPTATLPGPTGVTTGTAEPASGAATSTGPGG